MAQMVADGYLTQEQADLMAAREAVESHMDYEGLNAAVQEAYATAVQAALDAGEITQAQADQLLSEAVAAPSFHFDFGGRPVAGGHGRQMVAVVMDSLAQCPTPIPPPPQRHLTATPNLIRLFMSILSFNNLRIDD
ncbi:MAG: hypothetical protein H6669_19225 [Ardenticatenaceae bacterium]|nr:hypothetical protein [Ardenticatenaceae bacterium]